MTPKIIRPLKNSEKYWLSDQKGILPPLKENEDK
jgi:hypothetical protein